MALILQGDVLEQLATLADESVHCVITSPPYWGLRRYGEYEMCAVFGSLDDFTRPRKHPERWWILIRIHAALKNGIYSRNGKSWIGMIGLESTPELYIEHMVKIFREVRRTLRKDGTLWLNMGDSYASGKPKAGYSTTGHDLGYSNNQSGKPPPGLKAKDLVGMPWRLALALRADGWWLRKRVVQEIEYYCPCGCGYVMEERIWRHDPDREIIWNKPNPMPESSPDRPTSAHESVFILARAARYFYDAEAIREPAGEVNNYLTPTGWVVGSGNHRALKGRHSDAAGEYPGRANRDSQRRRKTYPGIGPQHAAQRNRGEKYEPMKARPTRNARDVWKIATRGFPRAHFATFPEALVQRCLFAGSSERGCCPECGAPWERVIEKTGHVNNREPAHVPGNSPTKTDSTGWKPTKIATDNWQPTCDHAADPVPCTVLDPFLGSGTVGLVAQRYGRHWIGIDLSPEYCDLAAERTAQQELEL